MRNKKMKHLIVIYLLLALPAFAGEDVVFNLSHFPESGLMRMKTENGYVWVIQRPVSVINALEEYRGPLNESDHLSYRNNHRSIKKEYFVTYSPCNAESELSSFDKYTGFVCSDCGKYDLAGRPINKCAGEPSTIPPHFYTENNTLVLPQ